jgi:hypothetical protein
MKSISRQELLKGCVRGGVLAGVVGLCTVLTSREEKFECSDQCGRCSKFNGGKCGLGLK